MLKLNTWLLPLLLLLLPVTAQAADVSGVPKIRDGDHALIGKTRIRLAGIDAPAVDQLCLNPKGDRWTCGIAARDALLVPGCPNALAARIGAAVGRLTVEAS